MYKHYILQKLAKMTKIMPIIAKLHPVGRISAQNQGIDPDLVERDPGKATDLLMKRFINGELEVYDPSKDEEWLEMIGKSASLVGGNMLDTAKLQNSLMDQKTLKEFRARMPKASTGTWAAQHNSKAQRHPGPFAQAEIYNKMTHMTNDSDFMPGQGSESLSLNTRQNISNPYPTYGGGRGAKNY